MKTILQEFEVDAEADVLTSCTDSGSNVKRALEVVFPTHREWCVSHLFHLALADAFRSSVDPSKTKNTEVCELMNACCKVIETVNKSKLLKLGWMKTCSRTLAGFQNFGTALLTVGLPWKMFWYGS
jgi:hypothetical protein